MAARRHALRALTGLLVVSRRIACAFFLLLPLGCGGADPVTGTRRGTFEPSWSEEFEGSAIDASRWHVLDEHQDAWPETPWRRNWKRENVTVEDGALVIRTVRFRRPEPPRSGPPPSPAARA